jgi:hypothetical protein
MQKEILSLGSALGPECFQRHEKGEEEKIRTKKKNNFG